MNDENLNSTTNPNNEENQEVKTPTLEMPVFTEIDTTVTSTTDGGTPVVNESETDIFAMGKSREIELTMAPSENTKSTPIAPQPPIGSSPTTRHDPISPRPTIGQAVVPPATSTPTPTPLRSDIGQTVTSSPAATIFTPSPETGDSIPKVSTIPPTTPIAGAPPTIPLSSAPPTASVPPVTPAPPISTVRPAPPISNTPPTPPTQKVEPTPVPPQQPLYHQSAGNQQPPQNYQGAPVPPQPAPVQQAPTPPWSQNRPTSPPANYQNQVPQMPPQQSPYGAQPPMNPYQNPGYQTFQATPPIMGMDPRILADIKSRNDKAFGLGIGSIVCAALSIVMDSFPGMLIFSIIALVLGLVGINSLPRGQYPNGAPMTATRSKVCCIVGAILGGLSLVFWVFAFLVALAWY